MKTNNALLDKKIPMKKMGGFCSVILILFFVVASWLFTGNSVNQNLLSRLSDNQKYLNENKEKAFNCYAEKDFYSQRIANANDGSIKDKYTAKLSASALSCSNIVEEYQTSYDEYLNSSKDYKYQSSVNFCKYIDKDCSEFWDLQARNEYSYDGLDMGVVKMNVSNKNFQETMSELRNTVQ